ncbi:MAG: transketolase-like TK C-terminal-containing protein, partial [Thermocrispum sp.]
HQPIEHLASLRAIPGLNVARPADANETAAVWKRALEINDAPTGLALTRQNVPVLDGTDSDSVARGGYVLAEADGGTPQVVLIGTGSEVQLAVAARETLQADGVPTRVVSMPCVEWFDAQDQAYRDSVIPPNVRARVAVEAGIAQPWHRFVGENGAVVGIEHFGASADWQTLFTEFGITADAVVQAAKQSLNDVKQRN